MKVAILSMQEVKNYGSFLQAYSLKHNILSLGHTCDFINIVPGEQIGDYRIEKLHRIKLLGKRLKGWDFLKRAKTIYQFQHRFTHEFFPELGVYLGEINTNHYDVVVIGSDEVFNCAQKTWFGFAPQLFGEGVNADKIITYAASFGATNVEILDRLGERNRVAALLKKLGKISVRDEKSAETVKILTDIEPERHLDPVFIFDYNNLMPQEVRLKDYMIVYTYPGRITDPLEIKAIQDYAQRRHLKLISIGHYFSWCDDVIVPHPFEVLALFKYAACIVTDTFHGSVFSIKYNKQFCTIVRKMNSNKLTSLLEQFDLSCRMINNTNELPEIMDTPIDYSFVNKKLAKEKIRSINYLKENLII
jgi:hypothetical protein